MQHDRLSQQQLSFLYTGRSWLVCFPRSAYFVLMLLSFVCVTFDCCSWASRPLPWLQMAIVISLKSLRLFTIAKDHATFVTYTAERLRACGKQKEPLAPSILFCNGYFCLQCTNSFLMRCLIRSNFWRSLTGVRISRLFFCPTNQICYKDTEMAQASTNPSPKHLVRLLPPPLSSLFSIPSLPSVRSFLTSPFFSLSYSLERVTRT